ncbi:MFS transporter [Actinoplanes sp. NBRC 14428]|uniref:Putative MFS family arabinose efflux permease n=1 Tax=Pseudosporangium ferrugineum TaxID=439699 RepID=A0A2T0RLP5_9ACTN|nr:MFS transporter [Pseudosporangium ferrugineum]PRY22033.1 putative MFS family arabinose efflux permease [Pseudosporangium ferrugineum]BCJ50691.1 MFS transporter [Actinoplanes sp. NBRC 14428]
MTTAVPPGLRRNANFTKLWAGQSISMVGVNVTYVALPLLAIYAIDAGAFEVGLITLAETLPYLVVTLWAGAWIDERKRIPVMLVADILRGAILVAVAVLTLMHLITLEIIVGLMLLYGVGSVFFEVAYYAVVPTIVHRSDLMRANSRLQTSASVSLLLGTNVGGLLTQILTAPFALIVDALTFVASALSLRSMKVDEQVHVPADRPPARRKQIWEGLRYVARQPVLRSLTASSALYNFFTNGVMTLFPVFAVKSLHLNAGTIGFVESFGAVGAVVGALVASRMISRLGAGPAYTLAKALTWAAVLSFGFAPAGGTGAVVLLAVAFSVSGMLIVSNVVGITLRQAVTEDHLLGRMTATYKFVSYGAQSLGALAGGIAGEVLGLRVAMIAGGIGLVTSVLVGLNLRRIRQLPTETGRPEAVVTVAR